jgi:Tfp pilus assembly protein PilF
MRTFLLLTILWICPVFILGQQQERLSQSVGPNTYAVVVGIAAYNNGIPNLEYANRDARAFSDFLKSSAGGAVPQSHIRLLEDSMATTAAVYDALYWLSQTCKKDDLVFFYFSGHGDMENALVSKNGVLLCSNTPPNNYIHLSLNIGHLNDYANTMSATNGANVVLITDACHSGKLSGNENRGPLLDSLLAIEAGKKEIRISACSADELSNENIAWGGGRGVFSYYLVNGFKGLADAGKDGAVTLNEIRNYISGSLINDPVLVAEKLKQTPVVKGRDDFVLFKVEDATLQAAAKEADSNRVDMVQSAPSPAPGATDLLNVSPEDHFFTWLENVKWAERWSNDHPEYRELGLEYLTDHLQLDKLPTSDSIVYRFLNAFITNPVFSQQSNKLFRELEQQLRESKRKMKLFSNRLAVAFDNRGQEIIDQYLNGDAAELERRRYYNTNREETGYDVYAKMFSVALKLTAPDNVFSQNILKVKLHYFNGLAARLKIPLTPNPRGLIDTAWTELNKALKLEENAAYIYNELGIICEYRNKQAAAKKYYLKAAELSPEWALPWANLTGLYASTGELEKGFAAAKKAKELQPGFQNTYINTGLLNEKMGNLLEAESLYRKSIQMNNRHYLPYLRLGFVYLRNAEYELANTFFYEAEIKMMGYILNSLETRAKPASEDPPNIPIDSSKYCETDAEIIIKTGAMGYYLLSMDYINSWDSTTLSVGEDYLKKVIESDKHHPAASYYLGKMLLQQKRWVEAELLLNNALYYHLTREAFIQYGDSVGRLVQPSILLPCQFNKFNNSYFDKAEIQFSLAILFHNRKRFTEAEKKYRETLKGNPLNLLANVHLTGLLEKTGQYADAEMAYHDFSNRLPEQGIAEQYAFYRRMTAKFNNAEWNYRAGNFLFEQVQMGAISIQADKKIINPQTGVEEKSHVPFWQPEPGNGELPATALNPDFFWFDSQAPEIMFPLTDGIKFLSGATESAQPDSLLMSDMQYKTGCFNLWQGLPAKAIGHFQQALQYSPGNHAARNRLAEAFSETYQLSGALQLLEASHQLGTLDFPGQFTLLKYLVRSGRLPEAKVMFSELKKHFPENSEEIQFMASQIILYENNPKEIIAHYTKELNRGRNDDEMMYTFARNHAKLGKATEALKWLEAARKAGFYYTDVIKNDPYLEPLRKSGKIK